MIRTVVRYQAQNRNLSNGLRRNEISYRTLTTKDKEKKELIFQILVRVDVKAPENAVHYLLRWTIIKLRELNSYLKDKKKNKSKYPISYWFYLFVYVFHAIKILFHANNYVVNFLIRNRSDDVNMIMTRW